MIHILFTRFHIICTFYMQLSMCVAGLFETKKGISGNAIFGSSFRPPARERSAINAAIFSLYHHAQRYSLPNT